MRGTETCPKHHGRSCFRGGVGRQGDKTRLSHQLGSCLHLASGRDPEGYILRGGEETPAEIPQYKAFLALLHVSLCCYRGALRERIFQVQESLGHLGAGWGQALGHLE